MLIPLQKNIYIFVLQIENQSEVSLILFCNLTRIAGEHLLKFFAKVIHFNRIIAHYEEFKSVFYDIPAIFLFRAGE